MTIKWLSRQGDPLQGHLHAANQQQKKGKKVFLRQKSNFWDSSFWQDCPTKLFSLFYSDSQKIIWDKMTCIQTEPKIISNLLPSYLLVGPYYQIDNYLNLKNVIQRYVISCIKQWKPVWIVYYFSLFFHKKKIQCNLA